MKSIFLTLFFFISIRISAQSTDEANWKDTTYILVNLIDSCDDKKIIVVEIGEKATIYLKLKLVKQNASEVLNDFNKKDISITMRILNKKAIKNDSIVADQYLGYMGYLISNQLQKGNAKVYYKKLKSFVSIISYRLEKYGMYAIRFFYLPDRRPFFSTMEYSGIIENDEVFKLSDPKELEKLGEKLSEMRKY